MKFDARGESGWGARPGADGRIRMPFGKHKDRPIEEVPDSYLMWVLDNVDMTRRPTLQDAIRVRLGLDRPDGQPGTGPDLEATIRAWFRALALDFHPDRRGSHEAMIAINEAHRRLLKMLKLRVGQDHHPR